MRFVSIIGFLLFTFSELMAAPLSVRWTGKQDANSDLAHVLQKINVQIKSDYTSNDFKLIEKQELATANFYVWQQVLQGVPVRQRSVRIWAGKENKNLIQMEAFLEPKEQLDSILTTYSDQGISIQSLKKNLSSQETMRLVRSVVKHHPDDKMIQSVSWNDQWQNDRLMRSVKVKGRRGYHQIVIDLLFQRVMDSSYSEFPQVDLPAQVYLIYEEPEKGSIQKRIPVVLKNLNDNRPKVEADSYVALRDRRYTEDKIDPILGLEPEYQAKGFWSPADVKNKARKILQSLPQATNDLAKGLVLDGKYATINLHPEILKKYQGINFTPAVSAQYKPYWGVTKIEDKEVGEMIPSNSLLGIPLFDMNSAANRIAQRHPNHDPVTYINDGFDEVQVYWAIDTLMTSLHGMGFSDPDISTRPFNAILYDPDISMKDNAYYTDDTINFTTYSPGNQNFARDNSTIWHELGHGIMDRLMGDYIELADTGGLSEGMADFLAQIIVQHVTGGQVFEGAEKFRINNQTGFHLTNEVHDDGEAYGGTMNDFLVKAIAKFGHGEGVKKVGDLTLEAMRLSRDHPGLTAQEWFNHMLFADELGSASRQPGELGQLLIDALKGRNYSFGDSRPASFALMNGKDEVTDKTPGSRGRPIPHVLKASQSVTYPMSVKLTSSADYKFKYPVTVKVVLEGGPIQGAIHWQGEEQKAVNYVLNSEDEVANFELKASGKCETINRDDGSCVDFAYIQIWNNGEQTKPVAKKRFYLRIKTAE